MVITIAFLFCCLFGRLSFIQLVQGAELQAKASNQWYRDLPLTAPRGVITDCCGEVLVDNEDCYTVYVRPNALSNKEVVAQILASELSLDYSKLIESFNKNVSEVTVARKVSVDSASVIRAIGLSGVYFTPDTIRNYPSGSALSKVLGYTDIDLNGQSGLEAYYNEYLKGVNGFAYTNTDLVGRETESTTTKYVPAIDGCNLHLSIDTNIQAFCDYATISTMQEYNAKGASMIVMDATNGGIVAMSSVPSFDLNDPPRDDIDVLNELTKNSMIADVFEPGSTFKIFTTAAALEQGVTSVDDNFFCCGNCIVDGQKIKCWKTVGHGSQTLAEGVMNSCNVVFMNLAQKMGVENFYDKLHEFGFNQKTNVDFYGESKGILMAQDSVKNVDLARIGFGQAVAVTPLQLITGVSSVVNGGTLYEPYFLSSVSDYTGKTIYTNTPTAVNQVLDASTSSLMRELLLDVVDNGSGKKAYVEGYEIGGKTGTAQKYENGAIAQGKYISSFVGFAPANDPKYAILMLVDEPTEIAYYGSIVAAPPVGEVFAKIFDYKQIPPTRVDESSESFVMPNLIGLTETECYNVLTSMGIVYEVAGDEGVVLSTLPIAGTTITDKEVVLLRLQNSEF